MQIKIWSLIFIVSGLAQAKELNPESLYYRCYAHFTRGRPAASDIRLQQVKAKTLNYVDACMQVFDSASLNQATGRLETENAESISVLETFNRFHMSWFDDVNIFNALVPGGENLNNFVHDGGEAALHFTRSIFFQGAKFSDAINGNQTYQAIRSKGYNTYAIYPYTYKRADNWGTKDAPVRIGSSTTDIPITQLLDPTSSHGGLHLQMGKIVGVMPMQHLSITGAVYNSSAFTGTTYSASYPISITKSFGGGLLGTQGYIMINRVLNLGSVLNGGLSSGRVYGKQVFKEILCRDIPVVQAKDVISLVDPMGTNGLPYRNGTSCMQCHSSIDSIGWATRDLRLNRIGNGGANNFLNVVYFLDQYKGTKLTQENGPVFGLGAATGAETNFYQRPARGHFYYRTYSGSLISDQFEGINELGEIISGMDDYYSCATKRYFEFFTGHKVFLEDITDSNSRKLNDKEMRLREFVINLGKKLHQNQSMREIVKEIISSDFYKTSDYEIKY